MATYYSILTNTGQSKIAAAQSGGPALNLTEFAVGDSGGAYFDPLATQTNLVNELWRGSVNRIYVHPNNANQIVIEAMIPAASGGFDIREAGVFDAGGDLIAVGKYPLTTKPAPGSGSEKDLYVRMILAVTNAASVAQTIDPSLVMATKEYVDTRDWRESVRAATTANVTDLAAGAPNTLDGVTLANGDRILVKDQANGAENGIYVVDTLGTGADGAWVRSLDADNGLDVSANFSVAVEEGAVNADSLWILTTDQPIILGTTALTFMRLVTQTELDGHAAIIANASTSGHIETATQTEVDTGLDSSKAVTSATLAGTIVPSADTVDGIHASATPDANKLIPLDANANLALLKWHLDRIGATDNAEIYNDLGHAFLAAKQNAHLCSNARWDGTNWNRIDTSQPAAMIVPEYSTGVLRLYSASAGANPISWITHYSAKTTRSDGLVNRGAISTGNGSVSRSASGWGGYTLPGGSYGFYPYIMCDIGSHVKIMEGGNTGYSPLAWISLYRNIGSVTASQTYIQASPPYRTGKMGIVPHFIFLELDPSGEIISSYEAPDPPWGHNGGPMLTQHERNFLVKQVQKKPAEFPAGVLDSPEMQEHHSQFARDERMKNVPHHIVSDVEQGNRIVMVDTRDIDIAKIQALTIVERKPLIEVFNSYFDLARGSHLANAGLPLGVEPRKPKVR